MRFGYADPFGADVSVRLIWCGLHRRKLAWVALSALSLGLTLVYGSRGVLIVIFMFFLLVFVFSKRIGKVLKAVVLMGGRCRCTWR